MPSMIKKYKLRRGYQTLKSGVREITFRAEIWLTIILFTGVQRLRCQQNGKITTGLWLCSILPRLPNEVYYTKLNSVQYGGQVHINDGQILEVCLLYIIYSIGAQFYEGSMSRYYDKI